MNKNLKKKNYKITVTKNGPYLVSGNLPLTKESIISDKEGYPIKYGKRKHYKVKEDYTLCRCGRSKNKPYCDKTHIKISFNGTETACGKNSLEQVKKTPGPALILNDVPKLCASARFCTRAGGIRELVKDSDVKKSKKTAIQQVCNCPSGSLEILDRKTNKPIEPYLKPSISLLEDPDKEVSGPIWIKGNIPIESLDKIPYKTRNRITLCRCGKSDNKPFCSGNHIAAGFTDDLSDDK